MTTPFYGYPGRVWAVALESLDLLTAALSATSTPFNTLPLASAVLNTIYNGIDAINANRISEIWTAEAGTMGQLNTLPITLTSGDFAYYTNRLASLTAGASGMAALVQQPSLTTVATSLNSGSPAIADPLLLEFMEGFNYETPPVGLNNSNFPSFAAQSAAAFSSIASGIAAFEGVNTDYIYDMFYRFAVENSAFAEMDSDFSQFRSPSPTTLWNQMFVQPTLLMDADLLSGSPGTLAAQQDMLIRYLMINAAQQVALFMMTTLRPVASAILQATVFTGDSLMDIAARAMGDFEQWDAIAQLNNLLPPYIGQKSTPGVAGWGSKIQIPTPGAVSGVVPSYLINFLGVDYYFGPINGDMPAWNGEFQTIGGYQNLRWALGRRMQTTLGTLIYHKDYGCRIPPEIGNVQVKDAAAYIAAFGESCLKSDPRVAEVPSATATLLPNFAIRFDGVVQPAGFGTTPIAVNEVINTATTPISPRGS